MCRPRGAWLLLLLALGAIPLRPASATIVNVPGGQPNILAAVAAAASGDTIIIAPGTYAGGAFINDKVLTIASRYLVTGDTSLVVQTIVSGDAGGACGDNPGCTGNSVLEFGANAHGSAIIGLTLTNGENGVGSASIVDVSHCRVISDGDGLDFSAGAGGTFSDNLIQNNSDDGIDLNGHMNVTIADNVIRNNGDDGIEYRIYDFNGATATTLITGNRISGNGEDGVQFIDYPGTSAYVLRVEHNILSANFNAAGSSAAIGIMPNGDTVESLVGAPMAERLYVAHNTFMGEKFGLVGGANVIALDNIFTGTQGSAVRQVTGNSIVSYSMFWNNGTDYETSVVDAPHLLHANPALNADGTLSAGSPAIDAGTAFFQWNGETVHNEPPGAYLGSAPDLGAVEYSSGGAVNLAPTVNAGANLTVTLPAEATLAGTVSDDGLPNPPGAMVTHWNVLSGAGPMAIRDPERLQTRATFSVPGVYVVQLTATDGALSSSDAVAVTVLPSSNAAPTVGAGGDLTITLPADALLGGAVSDDGLPNPPGVLTALWAKGTGPGAVSFQDPTLLTTRASFTAPGVYWLYLIATDGAISSRDSLQITVLAEPNAAPVVDAGSPQTVQLPLGAALNGTVTDDGHPVTPGTVTTAWVLLSGPDPVSIQDPSLVDTYVSFTTPGTYLFRLSAFDGALSGFATTQVTVLAPPPIDRRISAASDDTEEEAGTGNIGTNTADIELVTGATLQIDGLRFTNITVPPGATILNAYIQFEADETQSEVTNLIFQGQAADNAPTFTTAAHNVSSRPRTTASVNWSPVPWTLVGEQGPNQRTGDLKTIIQEIVNRPGWVSGSAIAIIVSGTGHRTARSFENVPAGAALLHIESGGAPAPPNSAPIVNAGPDQTITLPAGASLVGSAIDDGLPNPPATVTVTWSKGSGPGAVTFGNANAVNTTASFSTAGTYILRLAASDGALTTTDSLQVTVQPQNLPPTAGAGTDQTVILPAAAVLAGSASDDGLPNPPGALTFAWSAVSGPGPVTFQNASQLSTSASFTTAGVYQLRLAVSDGALGAADTVQITAMQTTSLERRIAVGTDDAEESASGSVNITSANLQLVFNATNQIDGLRFTGLTIPKGAVITTAYVQFTAELNESGATSLVIRGQAADNATTFTGTNLNVSTRARTADSVSWAPAAWTVGAAGVAQRTPELKTLIQVIVNRTGWVSGNALALIIQGTGVRTAYSFDGGAAQAALLHVEYATGAANEIAAAGDTTDIPEGPVTIDAGVPASDETGVTDGAAASDDPVGNAAVRGTTAAATVVHAVAPTVESAPRELALRTLGHSPGRGEIVVECALPESRSATLELHDVAGRRIAAREVGTLGAGRHRIALGADLSAGVYIARLTQAGRARVIKVTVLR